jgi:hypothetical protein
MRRRRKTVTVNFEAEVAMQEQLRAVAKADANRSVSSVLRAAVAEYLAKHRRQADNRDTAAA